MSSKKIVEYNGKKYEGEIVDFEAPPENFNTYKFNDGTTLKLKTSLVEVVRIPNEYGPTGDPIYVFTAQQLANITAPEHLKQPKN
jgi:hypothetical protein